MVTRHQRLQNSLAKFVWPNFISFFLNSYKHSLLLYPLAPMSYQEEFLVTISSRQVIRITKNINWGIISWLNAKFFKLIHKNRIAEELYSRQKRELLIGTWSERVCVVLLLFHFLMKSLLTPVAIRSS